MTKPLILIVDDEHANQFLLDGLLSAHGYETLIATNGEECISILETKHPELILLDIMMPRMTGIEVLEVMMRSETLRQIPVIMVTAKTGTIDVKEALEKGAVDYIKKPFDEVELLARVKVGIRLKQNEDHLRELITHKDEFVRIISHDLRSPFAAINGFAEILLGDKNLTYDQRESLGYIVESVEFSQDYFNKLLSWTNLESHDIKLNCTDFEMKRTINGVIKILEKKASEKQIELINEIPDGITIHADETFFRQAISNLINNAIKFTNTDGHIRCHSEKDKDGILCIVSDDGIGMPDDITPEKLFLKGFVESRRGTKGEKGTGIGLEICKKIADAHHFPLTFKKNPTRGTDFIIVVPNVYVRI